MVRKLALILVLAPLVVAAISLAIPAFPQAPGYSSSGSGSGASITVNGGSAVTSPVNFQNGTGGNTINFVAAGSNIQANIPTDTVTNAMLQNPGTTVSGQICSLGGSCNIPFSGLTGNASAGQISPSTCTVSNVTAQSSNQSAVTLCTSSLPAGQYFIRYYADMGTACTTGSNSVSFTFNWTDVSNARVLTTGSLTFSTAQATNSYLSGSIPIYASGSAAVTYTSTVSGTCATGTSTYDVHAEVTL
jgi:hypothetical protein